VKRKPEENGRLGPYEQCHDFHQTARIARSKKRTMQAQTRRLDGRLRFACRGLAQIPPRIFLLDSLLTQNTWKKTRLTQNTREKTRQDVLIHSCRTRPEVLSTAQIMHHPSPHQRRREENIILSVLFRSWEGAATMSYLVGFDRL
jgi:hypothetical protein